MAKCTRVESGNDQERYGAKVALAAFESMDREKESENEISLEAKAFISECEKAGRNPIEVVRVVAKDYGIKLSETRPDDQKDGRMYDMLCKVVEHVVHNFPFEDDDSEDDEEGEGCGNAAGRVMTRIDPFRKCRVVGYAFTW